MCYHKSVSIWDTRILYKNNIFGPFISFYLKSACVISITDFGRAVHHYRVHMTFLVHIDVLVKTNRPFRGRGGSFVSLAFIHTWFSLG